MHLSECVDLFSESNSFDREVGECIHNWLWKTRTEFFEHNGLILSPYFGALCWTYSLAGIVMLIIKPKCNWWVQSSFPYVTYALVLVFIQGTCTAVTQKKSLIFYFTFSHHIFFLAQKRAAIVLCRLR